VNDHFDGVLYISLYHYCEGEKASLEFVTGNMLSLSVNSVLRFET